MSSINVPDVSFSGSLALGSLVLWENQVGKIGWQVIFEGTISYAIRGKKGAYGFELASDPKNFQSAKYTVPIAKGLAARLQYSQAVGSPEGSPAVGVGSSSPRRRRRRRCLPVGTIASRNGAASKVMLELFNGEEHAATFHDKLRNEYLRAGVDASMQTMFDDGVDDVKALLESMTKATDGGADT